VFINFITRNLTIPRRKLYASTFLIAGTLAWFFLLNFYISDILKNVTPGDFIGYNNIGPLLFYGSAIFSALIGSYIGKRIYGKKLLLPWILLGMVSTAALLLFQGMAFLVIVSFLLGISMGLGLPSSMAYMSECTEVEERARVSGIIVLGTFLIAFIAMMLIRTFALDLIGVIVVFVAVRSFSLLALAVDDWSPKIQKPLVLMPSKVAYKKLVFYLLPWVIFSAAAGLAWNLIPLDSNFVAVRALGTNIRYICLGVFGLIAGFTADRFGRKPPIIAALIMLGVGFALIGFSMTPTSVLIYLILSGAAWGLLFVTFLAVPADLSPPEYREKFYGIGFISPVAILFALSTIPIDSLTAIMPASMLSQILSMVLFISIIPIFRVAETLPKEKMVERQMKDYMEKLEKAIVEDKHPK
jgi:MFS family permease